jgi:hypothetical protein
VKKLTLLLGALVFLSTLVVNAPASLVPALARAGGVSLALLDVEGSLWQGRVQGVQLSLDKRDWFVDTLTWQFKPFALLKGQMCLNITEGRAQGVSLRGELCVNQLGDITGQDLVMTSRVANALALAKFPLPVDGAATLTLNELDWSAYEGFNALTGEAFIKDYAYQVSGQREVLGDYRLNIAAPTAQKLALTFVPSVAKIALQGELSVDLGGAYEADLQFIPGPEASQGLVDSLRYVAVKQEDNSYRFKYSGRM